MNNQIAPQASNQTAATEPSAVSDVLFGGGEMGALMRGFDWSQTPLGPASNWPQSLKTAVRIMLTSRFPMFIWWGRSLVNLYNDPYRALLGVKHPAALGRSASDVWSEIWDQIGPRTDAVLLRGESTYDEALLLLMERHGYREETYFTFSYSPVPDDSGNIAGLFCAVTEETKQVIGERRLRLLREIAVATAEARTPVQVCESAERCLSAARRDLPFSLIYLFEPDGSLRRVAASGIASNHSAAPSMLSLDDSANSAWPIRQVIDSGAPVLVEDLRDCFTDLPWGEWREAPRCAALLPIAQQGQPRPAGVFIAGVNPHRKFDDDFQGFLSLLSNHIASAIANATAYEAARRRAEALAELDRAKTAFFSNISHEFRTPLTLLLGPLNDLASEEGESSGRERREQLHVARRNAVRLLRLVNTLLDFSRLEAGRTQAAFEPVDLARTTADVASVFRSTIEKAGLRFTVDCEPVESAYVDRDMWEKIVLNLVSNAFKFTFEGEITVSLKSVDGSAQLQVRDSGVGIPEYERERIFERFHRIENTTARSNEGTGIGLALVQELAKLHGGSVRAESTFGRGSTFTVSIPLGKAHLPSNQISRPRTVDSTTASADAYVEEVERWLPEETEWDVAALIPRVPRADRSTQADTGSDRPLIIIADDNADMRDYLCHLLRGKYRVQAVATGGQAMEAARRWRPDLILSDVMMPGMDGFALTAAVRSDPRLRSTPIVLLSARAGEESRVEGLAGGADDYLVKPFTARELIARVSAHVKMGSLRREAAEREEARARLAAIVASSDDAIISKNLDGIVTSWNPAAERMFGYTAEEMVGRSITMIIPPELQDDEVRILTTIARGERVDHFETERLTKHGERIQVSLTVSPVRDDAGRIVGAAKIARDITQQKKAERALRTTERLASVGRLAATVAHEINNPLEAVTNLVYLAKIQASREDVQQYLATAEEELLRIHHLTKQTLGFYRETVEPTPMRVGVILNSLLPAFASRARNKSVEISTEIKQDPEIRAVPGEVRQIIANLLSNSLDAVGTHGKIRLRVSPAVSWKDGEPGVRLTVADSGPGVPLEIRERVFEPFFTTKKDVGTGLGLWICKSILDNQGGTVRLRSNTTPGRTWTAFSVFLPDGKEQVQENSLKQAV